MKLTQISVLVLFVVHASVSAQTKEVNYNFSIKDRKGGQAKALSSAQIDMTDGGSRVDPKVLLYDGGEVVDSSGRKPSMPIRRLRLITLAFEEMDNEQRRLAKQIALDVFKEDKDPLHMFAVVMFSNQLSLLSPFTTNREQLRKAVDLATSGSANTRFAETHRASRAVIEAAAANTQALSDADVMAGNLDSNAALQGVLGRLQLGMLSPVVIDNAEASRRSISFLNSLATGLKSQPGRKAIAYLNAGLTVPTELDVPFQALHSRANDAGVSFYPIDCRGVNVAAQNAGVSDTTAANSANTTSALSGTENSERGDRPFGIENVVEGLRFNVQSALRVMAESTGGALLVESNDPKRLLREMIADTQTYYELTYSPQITDFNGAFRRTSVKLKQADFKIKERDGYLALLPGQENLLPYEVPLLKALGATPPTREVEFRSGSWRMKTSKDSVDGVVALEVPFAGIAFAQDAAKGLYAARLSLLAQVRDSSGKIIEKFTRDLPLKGKLEQLEALKNSNFNFRERFSAPAGRYVVETAVIDQLSGKIGARKTSFVGSAAATPLAVSSVSLVRNYQPNVKDLNPEDPFQYQGGRITPTLNTTFKANKNGQLALFFTVYPDASNGAPIQALVQYLKDGVLAGKAELPLPPADSSGRIRYVLSSPMEVMSAGGYEVKIVIRQGTASVAESIFLNIEP